MRGDVPSREAALCCRPSEIRRTLIGCKLFDIHSRYMLMDRFWAVILYVLAFPYVMSESVEYVERRIEYNSSTR